MNCFNIEMLLWGTDVVVNLTVRELVWRGARLVWSWAGVVLGWCGGNVAEEVLGWCGAGLVWWLCG